MNLYIGGLVLHILRICRLMICLFFFLLRFVSRYVALTNKLGLSRANITHVVSVLRMNPKDELFSTFKGHLHIPIDDVDNEDLLEHFPTTIAFIKEGLETGGGVLVHWLAHFIVSSFQ